MKNIELKDSGVEFNAESHTYKYNGKILKGITGTLINRAYPVAETYKDIDEAVLKHAAERGSACHQSVGNLYTIGIPSTGFETVADEAKRLLDSQRLTPVKFEYVVTDFKNYASPIDIVCLNEKNEICIIDMKFTAKLHYEQVTLQTSIYKKFFTIVNNELDAKHQYVLYIHTNDAHEVLDSGIYELQPVDEAFIDDLIKADEEDKTFEVSDYYGDLPAQVSKVESYLIQLSQLVKEKSDELERIKKGLTKLMLKNNVKKYSTAHLQLTAVTPKPQQTFDTARFKKEHSDMFKLYIKEAETKPSVRITIK